MSRSCMAMIASALAALLVASGAGAHGGSMTADEHSAEDSVVHTAAQEQALDAHTRAVSAPYAKAAAAAAAGAPQDVGQWGPVVDWPVVGVHVALLANGKVLAYDSVGDNATETYPVQDHTRGTVWDPATGAQTPVDVDDGLQHLLQRAGPPPRRPRVRRRGQQGSAAERDRPDAPVRSGERLVEPRPEHGGRALVSDGHAVEQRRDAHHLGSRRHTRGAHGRGLACARSAPPR